MKLWIKTSFFLTLVAVFFSFGLTHYASASACGRGNLFLTRNADVVWGNQPTTTTTTNVADISSAPNSQVRLSVSGEDGCAGTQVTFQILQGSSVLKTFTGSLRLGQQLIAGTSTRPALYQLYYDWTNDLSVGTYKFRTVLPIQAGPSSNNLNVQTSQACNLTKTYPNPNGGVPGAVIQLIVEAQGSCQNWKAFVNVINETQQNISIFAGNAQGE